MEVGERRRTSEMVHSGCFQEVGSEKEKGLAFRVKNLSMFSETTNDNYLGSEACTERSRSLQPPSSHYLHFHHNWKLKPSNEIKGRKWGN